MIVRLQSGTHATSRPIPLTPEMQLVADRIGVVRSAIKAAHDYALNLFTRAQKHERPVASETGKL